MQTKDVRKLVIIVFIVGVVIIGLALARYIITVNGNLEAQVANWSLNVSVDGNTNQNFEVDLADTRISEDSNQVESGYIAPGTKGAFDIVVDAGGSDALLVYNIDINTTNIPKNLHFYVDSNMKTEIFYSNKKFGYEGCFGYQDVNKTKTHTIYWDWPFESGETEEEILENDEDDSLWIGEEILLSLKITGTQVKSAPEYLAKSAEPGDYVDYIDGNGNTINCVVLYNSETKGLQIVSVEPTRSVTLGYDDPKVSGNSRLEKSINSYNRAVVTLNEYAMDYLNTNLAYNARCIGSRPTDKNFPNNLTGSEIESQKQVDNNTYEYFEKYNGICWKTDLNHITDRDRLDLIGKKKFNNIEFGYNCWYASHHISISSSKTYFEIRGFSSSGTENSYSPWLLNYDGINTVITTLNPTFGFRPVFYLKQNVKIAEGNGTETAPYQLINN